MNNEFNFNLGDTVVDTFTGFKGLIRARTQYLTGCNTYGVQPITLSKEGKIPEWSWLDESQLALDKKSKVKLNTKASKGGALNRNQIAPH